jgi:hypothetical protein
MNHTGVRSTDSSRQARRNRSFSSGGAAADVTATRLPGRWRAPTAEPARVGARPYPSAITRARTGVETLRDIVRHERDAQIAHFESLDSKAGLILGFAGTLVALAGDDPGAFADVGRGFAVLAAALALWAFFPRRYPLLAPSTFRSPWRGRTPEEMPWPPLDTEIDMFEQMSLLLVKKERRVRLSMLALGWAIGLLYFGILTE